MPGLGGLTGEGEDDVVNAWGRERAHGRCLRERAVRALPGRETGNHVLDAWAHERATTRRARLEAVFGPPYLDAPLRPKGWTNAITVRQLFTALRAQGVVPHPRAPEDDEEVAKELVDAVVRADRQPGSPFHELWRGPDYGPDVGTDREIEFGDGALSGTFQFGMAEGNYPRSDGSQPGEVGRIGTYANIAADISDMGGDLIRRLAPCDVCWGAIAGAEQTFTS